MSVDLEAIAQRGRCDVSSLRLALPLLEQGYTPPFLARYRRDELGGLDESSLWALSSALRTEQEVARRREELHQAWQQTALVDPAIGHAIKKSNSLRMLVRLGRRLKSESSDHGGDSTRLAVRALNPRQGDGNDFAEIAPKVEGIQDPHAAVDGLDAALARRLAGDPRIMAAAVRWLAKHARIHIASISDPHTGGEEAAASAGEPEVAPIAKTATTETATTETATTETATTETATTGTATTETATTETATTETATTETATTETATTETATAQTATTETATTETVATETVATESATTEPATTETVATETETPAAESLETEVPASKTQPAAEASDTATADQPAEPVSAPTDSASELESPPPAADTANAAESAEQTESVAPAESAGATDAATPAEPATSDQAPSDQAPSDQAPSDQAPSDQALSDQAPGAAAAGTKAKGSGKGGSKPTKSGSKATKKHKKISPRQRRRRWLVGVLKPLEGKRLACDKLSSFQIVMIGRALRSQVAQCSFEYDANKLVAELQRVASGINRQIEEPLRQLVLEHEANIREAAEASWWDDLHERASARLVTITADHLRRHVNRGAVEAKVVMAIDAVGPRTAATSIVSADGRLLHNEDLPCQLSSALRSQAVAKIGELIHTYHVDLLVISNGPARRATMIALSDLIAQSPEKSVRWTLADRSGADAYASSTVANEEMRSTPRRFRAAAWLAFSVLQPAQALAKVDPLKLRLSSFQRELSEEAMLASLEDVIISGASRGGVDANSAPVSWLQRLPGVSADVAAAIDQSRRKSLFDSRAALSELEQWEDTVQSRQAIPFLRVFGSEEVLDGTLIHPDDYALAKKLAAALEIELPPNAPPGYVAPDFSALSEPAEPVQLAEARHEPEPIEVEEFTAAGEKSPEFAIDSEQNAEPEAAAEEASSESTEAEPESTTDVADDTAVDASLESGQVAEAAASESAESETSESEPESAAPESAAPESAAPESAASESAAPESESTASETQSVESAPATAVHTEVPDRVVRPKPAKAKTDKCVKEWQIGSKRAHQLVQWLCDPFGDSDSTGNPPAVLTTMPTSNTLQPGDQAIGVVVGVMPFGVFVELAPDCSGLIHVSRVSDSYIDDLHEAVQVGDVITTWVTGVDQKRRRVALSALSPQREAELEETRRSRDSRQQHGGGRHRGGGGGRARGAAPSQGTSRAKDAAAQGQTGQAQGAGQSRGGGQGRGGQSRGGQGGQSRGGQGGATRSRDARGGRSRDARGGRGRDKKPESYRIVGKKEAKPITDAMQKGEEPLRSFGDLLQFYDTSKSTPESESQSSGQADDKPSTDQTPSSETPSSETPSSETPSSETPSSDTPTSAGNKTVHPETPPATDAPPTAETPPATDAPPTSQQAQDTSSDQPKAADEPSDSPSPPKSEPSSPADAST